LKRYFLLGPTASSKTSVALDVAPELNAEILSMDSMLVYRHMDLGTAKPSAEELAKIPHHLLDLVDPKEDFSVAKWLQCAKVVEQDLEARGKAALYVGGTNLYLKALTSGLLTVPEASHELRLELKAEWETRDGQQRLRKELQDVDPGLIKKVHVNDTKRLLRGIEVYRATGRSLSDWQSQWKSEPIIGEPAVALHWPREILRDRVAQRFETMMRQGFLDEIRKIQCNAGFGSTAGKALGYRQMIEHLSENCSLEVAQERSITLTRTYIRRQMTWLRSFEDLQWVEMLQNDTSRPAQEVAAEVVQRLLDNENAR
jgi:tRNA dimethylallyltransferase